MSIDWEGKLETDNGEAQIISGTNNSNKVTVDGVIYWVNVKSGNPVSKKLPRSFSVRNKKTVEGLAIETIEQLNHPRAEFIVGALKEAGLLRED